jgi:hypothetical protein
VAFNTLKSSLSGAHIAAVESKVLKAGMLMATAASAPMQPPETHHYNQVKDKRKGKGKDKWYILDSTAAANRTQQTMDGYKEVDGDVVLHIQTGSYFFSPLLQSHLNIARWKKET